MNEVLTTLGSVDQAPPDVHPVQTQGLYMAFQQLAFADVIDIQK
jgi:hypothetical protein